MSFLHPPSMWVVQNSDKKIRPIENIIQRQEVCCPEFNALFAAAAG